MSQIAPTRRQSISAFTATAAALAAPVIIAPATARADTPTPLKDLAAAKGMRFGSAVGVLKGGFNDPRTPELLARECNILVPENELKMYTTHKAADRYDFAPADMLLKFADDHGMAMRGHNLFWARDDFTPQWLKDYDFGTQPKLTAEKLLRDYIATVTDHYGTRLTSWDVINETIDPKTGEVRNNVFSRILGMDALRIAYEATREHLPQTQLVYNDYMSWEAGNETHRAGVLKLLHWFRDNKIPVDAVGVQSHIGNGFDLLAGQVNAWKGFLDEIVAMDYGLLITEFDVDDQRIPTTDIAQRDAIVATVARIYLDQMFDYKQLRDVLCWGMDDHLSLIHI